MPKKSVPDTSSFDYATPYDIMVGAWTGHSILYDSKGVYQSSTPSILCIYWKEPGKVLRYFQEDMGAMEEFTAEHESSYAALIDTVQTRAFDLIIDPDSPKACFSSAESLIRVQGVESRPGTYLFHLEFPADPDEEGSQGGNYYNNQYFTNPNERHIIGPYVPKKIGPVLPQEYGDRAPKPSDFNSVIAQTFTRISYADIPASFKRFEEKHLKNLEKQAAKTA
jgi:hypothetical protein